MHPPIIITLQSSHPLLYLIKSLFCPVNTESQERERDLTFRNKNIQTVSLTSFFSPVLHSSSLSPDFLHSFLNLSLFLIKYLSASVSSPLPSLHFLNFNFLLSLYPLHQHFSISFVFTVTLLSRSLYSSVFLAITLHLSPLSSLLFFAC